MTHNVSSVLFWIEAFKILDRQALPALRVPETLIVLTGKNPASLSLAMHMIRGNQEGRMVTTTATVSCICLCGQQLLVSHMPDSV